MAAVGRDRMIAPRPAIRQVAAAALAFVIATAAAYALHQRYDDTAAAGIWMYLPVVLPVTLYWGLRAGLATALAAVLLVTVARRSLSAHRGFVKETIGSA
jgi:hypothetical protein